MNEQIEIEQMKRALMQQILEKDATERLARIRLANPALASQVENYLIQAVQSGQITKKVDDSALKQMLEMISNKRKTRIVRK